MISLEVENLQKAKTLLLNIPKGATKACSRALNRAAQGVVTDTAKLISSKYVIKQSDLKKKERLNIRKASSNNLTAYINFKGKRIPLINFKIIPKKFQKGRKKRLITAQVFKGTNKTLPNNYFVNTTAGRLAVLLRPNKTRYPIYEAFGPAIPQMVGTNVNRKILEDKAKKRLTVTLEHEIDRLISGNGVGK